MNIAHRIDDINPRVANALRDAALIESGGKMADGGKKIPILSPEPHRNDKPGQHCTYFVESCSAYEYSRQQWIGGLELCERWNIDVQGLGGFYKDNYRAGGVGVGSVTPAAPRRQTSTTDPVSTQDSADFEQWQTSAAAMLDALPSAAATPAATEFLCRAGYTLETITARGVKYNPTWQDVQTSGDGPPAKLAPGILYPHHDQHGKPSAVFTRLLNPKPGMSKTIQLAGGKPKLGIYGNLDTLGAPVIITAGQKDCDLVRQTFPGPVNAITMGSCNVSLPAWAVEKIAALQPAFVMVMFDNDPPQEQHHAELQAAELRAVLPCPVLVVPPPKGFKDFADAVASGSDVGNFWANIVAPMNIAVIELLCSFKRFAWVDKAHGDPAYLAAVLLIRRAALAQGLIAYDTPLSIPLLLELAERVGHPLTEKAARAGVGLAVNFKVWIDPSQDYSDFDLAEFGYVYKNKIPLSNFGKNENATRYYLPLPAFAGYRQLAAALENEIPTTWHDWADGEFLEELDRHNIADTRPAAMVDRYDTDGAIYQVVINETADLLDQLDLLRDAAALVLHPFTWPDGFTLSDYPNKPDNARPNAPKCLRVALLWALNEQNTRRIKTESGEVVEGWEISGPTLARRLGIGVSSVSEYRRAAGLTTFEQKPRTQILGSENKRQQVERIIGNRKAGVRVIIGAVPSYLTDQNRESILKVVETTPYSVAVEIQRPSIQYAAPPEKIEAIRVERSERHKARVERAQRDRREADSPPKERTARPAPEIAPYAPEIAAPGYTKLFVYYHLLKMLPALLEAAKTSVLIARVLVSYGLSERDLPMPKDESFKDADLENAAEVVPHISPPPKPVYQPAPRPGQNPAGYPFADEAARVNRPVFVSRFRKGA